MSPELFQSLTSTSYSLLSAFAHSLGIDDLSHLSNFGHFDHMSLAADVHPGADVHVATTAAEGSDAPIEYKEIHALGSDPVAHATPGRTAIENGFTDTTDNGIDDSPIEKSAAEVAKKLGMNPEQTKDFLKQVHDHKQQFIDASKVTGYNKDGVKDVLIQQGEAVMGNGSGGAEDVRLNLKHPEQAVQTVITLADGTKVDFTVADKCANPILSVHQEPPVAPVVEAPKPVEVAKNPYAVYGADLKCESGCADQIGVVTRDGLPAGSVWEDTNGDGHYWKVQHVRGSSDLSAKEVVLDRQEFHAPDRATVDRDIAELRKHGFNGTTVVYNLTDTEGKNVVACYNTQTHEWKIFSADHSSDPVEKIPPGHPKFHYILDSRTLNADLSNENKTY